MLLFDGISSWLKFKLVLFSHTHDWPKICQTGRKQSPIAVCRENSTNAAIPPLEFRYYNNQFWACVENTGHSVFIRLCEDDKCEIPTVTGGGLDGEFILDNIHFHWASEHTINGKRYPLEAHLVHFNKKCGTLKNALKHPQGLTVLAVMYRTANCCNHNLENVVAATENIACQIKTPTLIQDGVVVNHFLPKNKRKFFTYEGSLTTPDCNENVKWIIFEEAVPLGQDQLNRLTDIASEEGKPLKENARSLQEQKDREVFYASDASTFIEAIKFWKYIKKIFGKE